MHTNAGIFEEKKLEKAYDIKLLWRIFPFVTPYRLLLSFSILMAIMTTLLDLSIPYITKIAIDRYIVPKAAVERLMPPPPANSPLTFPGRILQKLSAVTRKYLQFPDHPAQLHTTS